MVQSECLVFTQENIRRAFLPGDDPMNPRSQFIFSSDRDDNHKRLHFKEKAGFFLCKNESCGIYISHFPLIAQN
jgi:hypothetical protein